MRDSLKILCIDDEFHIRENYRKILNEILRRRSSEKKCAGFVESGLSGIDDILYKVGEMGGLNMAIIDLDISETIKGTDYVKPLKEKYPDAFIIIATDDLSYVVRKIENYKEFRDCEVLEKSYVLNYLEDLIEGYLD